MKYFQFTWLVFSFLISAFNYSPAQQLALKTYTVEDGLIQSSVYSIIQDRNGYMWFGTEGGVSKFNGSRFINYTPDEGLAQNHVRAIHEDKNGNIWFGTDNGGISRLTKNSFRNFSARDGIGSKKILCIYEDESGALWFGTEEGGISVFKNNKFSTITTKEGLHSNTIRTIFRDSKGHLWFSSGVAGGGVCVKRNNEFSYFSEKDGLSDVVITIAEDNDGNIWFGTISGVIIYNRNDFKTYSAKDGLTDKAVISLYCDKNNIMWIGTNLAGLYKFEEGRFEKCHTTADLSNVSILSITQDNRGDVWIGTRDKGVNRLPAERFVCYPSKTGIYAISEDNSGNIWIGDNGEGITRLQGHQSATTLRGLSNNQISSILFHKDGKIWIGTQDGLNQYDGRKIKVFSDKDGLCDFWINSIVEDEAGRIWIATANGLSCYVNGTFLNYSKKDGLADSVIYSILSDQNGAIWIGTEAGLSRLKGEKIQTFTVKDGLISNQVLSIYEDSEGTLWFGTNRGISRYNGQSFKNFSKENGLSDNIISYAIDDGKYLYIGTNNGINVIELSRINSGLHPEFKIYTAKEGLLASECAQGGVFKDSHGNIWFGSVKGLTKYNPDNRASLVASPTILTNLLINDKEFSIENNIDLAYTQNYLRFEFNAISFAFAEKLLYKYKLDGIDNHWTESREPSVSYPYLPPGNYTFRVRAKNGDGVWSNTPAVISFVINPPFWARWWFRTLLSVIAITFIYLIYVIKTRQVKKRNIELAKMVRERTHELELEKNKSEELLHNILPATLVEELKHKGFVQPREFKNVSIMFTDFKGFTYIASVLPAEKLVNELNDMFKDFDTIIAKYNLEKLKTIGDSYMVGAGLPMESEDHAVRIIKAGLEMQQVLKVRNETSAIKWEMRTGVHSGYVIAGVVGTKKFSYDIWGDTVNIASRMESAGSPGEINISAYTYMLVRDHFECEYRGKVTAKGKGDLDMYFVKCIKTKSVEKTAYSAGSAINI